MEFRAVNACLERERVAGGGWGGCGARLLLAVIHQISTPNPVLKSNSNDAASVKIIYHKVVFEPFHNPLLSWVDA